MSAYANFIEPKNFVRVPMVETHTYGVKGLSLSEWKKHKEEYDCVCCEEQGNKDCCPPHKRLKSMIDDYWQDYWDCENREGEYTDKTNYTEWTRAELDEHNELNPHCQVHVPACDDITCIDCDYYISKNRFDRGKGRIMFNDVVCEYTGRPGYRCGCCDDRVSDPEGMFPDTDSEE